MAFRPCLIKPVISSQKGRHCSIVDLTMPLVTLKMFVPGESAVAKCTFPAEPV